MTRKIVFFQQLWEKIFFSYTLSFLWYIFFTKLSNTVFETKHFLSYWELKLTMNYKWSMDILNISFAQVNRLFYNNYAFIILLHKSGIRAASVHDRMRVSTPGTSCWYCVSFYTRPYLSSSNFGWLISTYCS